MTTRASVRNATVVLPDRADSGTTPCMHRPGRTARQLYAVGYLLLPLPLLDIFGKAGVVWNP